MAIVIIAVVFILGAPFWLVYALIRWIYEVTKEGW